MQYKRGLEMNKLWILILPLVVVAVSFAADKTWYSYPDATSVPDNSRIMIYDGATKNVTGSKLKETFVTNTKQAIYSSHRAAEFTKMTSARRVGTGTDGNPTWKGSAWPGGTGGGHSIHDAADNALPAQPIFRCLSGAKCANAPGQTRLTVPEATTSASGLLSAVDKKKTNLVYDVLRYGWVCDGNSHPMSSSEAAELNAEVNIGAVAGDEKDWGSIQVVMAKMNPKGKVDLPYGTCILNKSLNVSDGAETIVSGSGPSSTVLKFTNTSSNGIEVNHTTYNTGGGINNLTIQAGITPGYTSGSTGTGIVVRRINDLFAIKNVDIKNFDTGISYESCWYPILDTFRILYFKDYGIHIKTNSDGFFGGSGWYNNGKICNTGKTDAPNSIGIKIEASGGEYFNSVDITSCNQGVVAKPEVGHWVLYLFFKAVLADSSTEDGFVFDGTNGTLSSVELSGSWAGYNGGNGVTILGQYADNIIINGGRYRENGKHGIHLQGGVNTSIIGSQISSNGRLYPTPTYDGIHVDAGVGSFNIKDCLVGNYASVFSYQRYGISIDAGASDKFSITGNDLRDNATGGASFGAYTGINRNVYGNLGYNFNIFKGGLRVETSANGTAVNSYTSGPSFAGWVANRFNGSLDSPTKTLNNDELMVFGGRGHTGSGFSSGNNSSIYIRASDDFSSTSTPTLMQFYTTPIGSTSQDNVMTLFPDGRVSIGSYFPADEKLHVDGNIKATSFIGNGSLLTGTPKFQYKRTITLSVNMAALTDDLNGIVALVPSGVNEYRLPTGVGSAQDTIFVYNSSTSANAYVGTAGTTIDGSSAALTLPPQSFVWLSCTGANTWVTSGKSGAGTTITASDKQIIFSDGSNNPTGAATLYWDKTNSRLGVNTSTPTGSIDVYETTKTPGINLRDERTVANGGGSVTMRHSNASDTFAATGDQLGLIRFGSRSGGSNKNAADITAVAGSTHSSTNAEGYLSFWTTAASATTSLERLRIQSNGNLRFSNQSVPSTTTSAGTAGDIAIDAPNGYLYLCTATNTWRRVQINGTW